MTAIDLTALRLAQHAGTVCAGSGHIIRAERSDGNGITTCPGCHRLRATTPIDGFDYRIVEPHLRGLRP